MLSKYIAYSKYHLKKKMRKIRESEMLFFTGKEKASLQVQVVLEHLQRCSVCDPAENIFQLESLVHKYVLFRNPTNKTEITGTAKRWGTTNSKPRGLNSLCDGPIRNTEQQQSGHIYYTLFCMRTVLYQPRVTWVVMLSQNHFVESNQFRLDFLLSTAGDALKAVFVWELTFLIYIILLSIFYKYFSSLVYVILNNKQINK